MSYQIHKIRSLDQTLNNFLQDKCLYFNSLLYCENIIITLYNVILWIYTGKEVFNKAKKHKIFFFFLSVQNKQCNEIAVILKFNKNTISKNERKKWFQTIFHLTFIGLKWYHLLFRLNYCYPVIIRISKKSFQLFYFFFLLLKFLFKFVGS